MCKVVVGQSVYVPRTNGGETLCKVKAIIAPCAEVGLEHGLAHVEWVEMRPSPQFDAPEGACVEHFQTTLGKWVRADKLRAA